MFDINLEDNYIFPDLTSLLFIPLLLQITYYWLNVIVFADYRVVKIQWNTIHPYGNVTV